MARLPLVKIGIVGLDSDWLENLGPAIDRMQSRVRVAAVYDDRAIVAQNWAAQRQTKVTLGIRSLLAMSEVDAILLGAIGWQGDWLLERLLERNLPILFGSQTSLSDVQLDACCRASLDEGVVMMPELRLRYLPATLRLRELLATTLGPVRRMAIHLGAWSRTLNRDIRLADVLDLCAALIGHSPDAVEPLAAAPAETTPIGVRLIFPSRCASGSTLAEAVLTSNSPLDEDESAVESSMFLCELECEKGAATIAGTKELHWSDGGEPHQERLTGDRSSTEVVLDLFARRVFGGLIPTPDLDDLKRAHALAAAVRKVAASRKPQHIDLRHSPQAVNDNRGTRIGTDQSG